MSVYRLGERIDSANAAGDTLYLLRGGSLRPYA